MAYRRILSVQDISCVGQCSLTAALPILSVCGLETAVLPTAVLSTHTGGCFAGSGYTFRDLSDDIPAICAHWRREGIRFSAVCTGYLGSPRQVADVLALMEGLLLPGGVRIVDPAMADGGRLYAGLPEELVPAMARLVFSADVILPNLTEAALLTGLPYRKVCEEAYARELTDALLARGAKTVVLTGVRRDDQTTGVAVRTSDAFQLYTHARVERVCHGTGDIFTAAFTGAYLRGQSAFEAARLAADFTLECIRKTMDDPEHWYGVKFELALPWLMRRLGE